MLAAAQNQRGVFELDGMMVDMPVLRRAERIIGNGGDEPRQ